MMAAVSASAQFTVNIQWQSASPGYSEDSIYYDADRKLTGPILRAGRMPEARQLR